MLAPAARSSCHPFLRRVGSPGQKKGGGKWGAGEATLANLFGFTLQLGRVRVLHLPADTTPPVPIPKALHVNTQKARIKDNWGGGVGR